MLDEQNSYDSKREIEYLLQTVQLQMPPHERAALQQQLKEAVAHLITNDFEKLVRLLYTVDVDEKRLKSLLQQQPQKDAADTIALLLIERQMQKAITRQQFRNRTNDDENEERW